MNPEIFDIDCRACSRLARFLDTVKERSPEYHCRPVPPFGDSEARFLIVGLAPGMHGANRTGRPFTGDYAGILLYQMLHKFGFASDSESMAADDGLMMLNCRITNAVKCLPPENKPIAIAKTRYFAQRARFRNAIQTKLAKKTAPTWLKTRAAKNSGWVSG